MTPTERPLKGEMLAKRVVGVGWVIEHTLGSQLAATSVMG
jgi:hypothetical protein